MPTLVRKTRTLLWRESRYDMTLLADGARYDCAYGLGGDYRCKHRSFVASMQRWAREHGCVVHCEPLMTSGAERDEQVGTAVQFFWDLAVGDPLPKRFRDVDDAYVERTGVPGWGPQCRPEYAAFPYERG